MEQQLVEFVRRRPRVRAFTNVRDPGFADCAPSGRVRLDALACWLQDIAYADVADAGLDRVAAWVVRRIRIRVDRFPRFRQRFELTTFCSGLGRMWAERRTDIVAVGEREPAVEAVTLWVHLDPDRWRPKVFSEHEIAVYAGPPPHRRVSAKLRHPVPRAADGGRPWMFRLTDCDVADHVNNAVYFEPLEEELLAGPEPDPERIDVEVEYRTPSQAGTKRVLSDGDWRWIVGADGELHASMLVRNGLDG